MTLQLEERPLVLADLSGEGRDRGPTLCIANGDLRWELLEFFGMPTSGAAGKQHHGQHQTIGTEGVGADDSVVPNLLR